MVLPPRPSEMAAAAAAAAKHQAKAAPSTPTRAASAPAAAPSLKPGDVLSLSVSASEASFFEDARLRLSPTTLRSLGLKTADAALVLIGDKGETTSVLPAWPDPSLPAASVGVPSSAVREGVEQNKARVWPLSTLVNFVPLASSISLKLTAGGSGHKLTREERELLVVKFKCVAVPQDHVLPGQVFSLSLLTPRETPYLLEVHRITGPRGTLGASDVPNATQATSLAAHAKELAKVVFALDHSTAVSVSNARSAAPAEVKQDDATGNVDAYEGLGGLESAISELRGLIELPLKKPELFQQYGLRPPGGVLLYGPPGTGKTTLASACAKACGIPSSSILHLSGPSLSSSLHGRSEARLRALFEKARKRSPSIIIIDEIDALAPRREAGAGSEGAGEVERRVVATLLTLMDGLGQGGEESEEGGRESESEGESHGEEEEKETGKRKPRVFVIAATNRPNAIDPALRRPGRLDREIEIGIPTAPARRDILRVLLKHVPHSLSQVELDELAASTHGFVGADLSALVREAGMRALQRVLTPLNSLTNGLSTLSLATSNEASSTSLVSSSDFTFARTRVRASAMRELFVELPKVGWADIAPGTASVHDRVRECVEWPLRHAEALKRLGVKAPAGVLLYGPPGCSKTLIARALASESGLNFVAVKGPELFNKYVGESERALREVFTRARAASPSIIFFDEIDALTATRGGGGGSVADGVIATLLNEMDGVEALTNVIVVAATNRPEIIDPALLRPGRLDRLLYVGPPDLEARRQILEIRSKHMATSSDVNLDSIAELTHGCSGAEVVSVCQDAGMRALNEDIAASCVRQEHLLAAAKAVRRRITPSMIAGFEKWRDQATI